MTTRREAELETENRMLREQVADLKAVIEQISRPGTHHPVVYYPSAWYPANGAAGYPWYSIVSSGGEAVVTPASLAGGSSTVTMNTPSPVTFS